MASLIDRDAFEVVSGFVPVCECNNNKRSCWQWRGVEVEG